MKTIYIINTSRFNLISAEIVYTRHLQPMGQGQPTQGIQNIIKSGSQNILSPFFRPAFIFRNSGACRFNCILSCTCSSEVCVADLFHDSCIVCIKIYMSANSLKQWFYLPTTHFQFTTYDKQISRLALNPQQEETNTCWLFLSSPFLPSSLCGLKYMT